MRATLLAGVVLLGACAHSLMRGSVVMKISDHQAHICMGRGEVAQGTAPHGLEGHRDIAEERRRGDPGGLDGREGEDVGRPRLASIALVEVGGLGLVDQAQAERHFGLCRQRAHGILQQAAGQDRGGGGAGGGGGGDGSGPARPAHAAVR